MTLWEKYNPLTGLSGRLMKDQLREKIGRKMTAPRKIQPRGNEKTLEIIEHYHKNLDIFLDYISKCREVDLDRTIITSPIISVVTYSLRDALQFLVDHEHRHIQQAIRVKSNENFPGRVA